MAEIHEHGPRLAQLEGQVGGLQVQMTNMQNGMTEQGHKLDRIMERMTSKEPTQWGWIASGLLLLGMLIALYTQPLHNTNVRQTEIIDKLVDTSLKQSRDVARLDERSLWMKAYMEATEEKRSPRKQ